jgi:hypothetical protein
MLSPVSSGSTNLPTVGEQLYLQYWIFYSSTTLAVVGGQANLSTVREQQCLQYWIFFSSNLRIVAIDTFCCEDAWLLASKKGRHNSEKNEKEKVSRKDYS